MDERAAAFRRRVAREYDIDIEVETFPAGTETAADAARAVGCDRAQIASSLAFAADELLVVITSGANRVDTGALAALRGTDSAELASPDAIEATLGYPIGGVPPICHDESVPVYLDEMLTEYDTVWAAAGSPDAVFPIAPDRLIEIADAEPVGVAE